MSKAKKLQVKQSVLEWCRQQVKEGHDLAICWEGGGDSGWAHFEIDEKETSNEYTEYLVDLMYSQLDYGSWAGEFSASGKAHFNPEENSFIGIDNYSEDETVSYECDIEVKIPKTLWFDSVSIQIEADDEDTTPRVDITFNIKNGFLTSEHEKIVKRLELHIQEETCNVVDRFVNDDYTDDYRGVWYNIIAEKSEFEEKGDYYIYKLDEIEIRSATVDEKNIYLQIEEDEMLPTEED
jgi:hypothetical protein